jgi:catechol 2,3-dioxygenase-like lactoylglutathione lyase family enzyme
MISGEGDIMNTAASDQGAARVEGIFHPVISVSAMDDALRFYRDILRLTVTFDDLHDPAAISRLFAFEAPVVRSVVLECADRSEFELVEFRNPKGRRTTDREMNDAGIAALALRVSGLDELVERVHAGGFTLSSGVVEQILPDGAILKVAVCRGPDNVKVILVQPPAGRKSLADEG